VEHFGTLHKYWGFMHKCTMEVPELDRPVNNTAWTMACGKSALSSSKPPATRVDLAIGNLQ
jgi:hypothetical protein